MASVPQALAQRSEGELLEHGRCEGGLLDAAVSADPAIRQDSIGHEHGVCSCANPWMGRGAQGTAAVGVQNADALHEAFPTQHDLVSASPHNPSICSDLSFEEWEDVRVAPIAAKEGTSCLPAVPELGVGAVVEEERILRALLLAGSAACLCRRCNLMQQVHKHVCDVQRIVAVGDRGRPASSACASRGIPQGHRSHHHAERLQKVPGKIFTLGGAGNGLRAEKVNRLGDKGGRWVATRLECPQISLCGLDASRRASSAPVELLNGAGLRLRCGSVRQVIGVHEEVLQKVHQRIARAVQARAGRRCGAAVHDDAAQELHLTEASWKTSEGLRNLV